MVNIKTSPDRIIFDGHADTAKECETITLMCDELARSEEFRTIEYRRGYAEFEKVGVAKELKFISGTQIDLSINTDTYVTVINGDDGAGHIYNYPYPSGDTSWTIGWTFPIQCSVTFVTGYIIDNITVTGSGAAYLTVSNITDSTFTITAADENAGVGIPATLTITSKQSVPKVSIDLTTLSGYSTLTKGSTYSLTVKAKAQGYQDSDASAAVSYTVPQATLAAPVITASDTTITWDAVENADSYDVYVDDELYENVTGDTVTLISFTIDGTTYQAEDGMTWNEWCNSSYNTVSASIDGTANVRVPSSHPGDVGGYRYIAYNNTYEVQSNVIVADKAYVLLSSGAGN